MTGVIAILPAAATSQDAAASLAAAAEVVPSAAVPLPLLLLLAGPADEGAAALVSITREVSAASGDPAMPFAAVRAVSIAADMGADGTGGPYSESGLLDGLRWLAEQAPPQPRLEVCIQFRLRMSVPFILDDAQVVPRPCPFDGCQTGPTGFLHLRLAVQKQPLKEPSQASGTLLLPQVATLRSHAERFLQELLLPLRLDWAASPAAYVTAHNTALSALSDRIR